MSNNDFNRASGLLQQDWSNAQPTFSSNPASTRHLVSTPLPRRHWLSLAPRAYDVSRPRPRQVSTDLPNCPRLTFGCAHDDEMPQAPFSSVIGKPH